MTIMIMIIKIIVFSFQEGKTLRQTISGYKETEYSLFDNVAFNKLN